MPFIGQTPVAGAYQILDSITTSATNTFALTLSGSPYYPETAQNLIVSLNGVTQAPVSAYTVDSSNIVFASSLTASDVIDYILVLGDVLDIATPSDNTVSTSKLQNYSVTSVKMSNTGVTATSYGSASAIPVITIDAAGRITSASTTAVAGIANTNWYSANNTFAIGTGDGSTFNTTISQFENLTITGDLVVNGNTTTIAANELKVEDSLIQLATNNEISDTIDIGFVGHYSNDGGNTALHTGFFRDASDEQYYLFNSYEDAAFDTATPPSTIDRTANTFTLADLNVGDLTMSTSNDPAITMTDTGFGQSAVIKGSNGNLRLESTTATIFDMGGSSQEIARFDSNGRFGIGTGSTVDGLLHLKSTGPIEVILEADSDNVTETDNPRIVFKQDGSAVIARVGYLNGSNDFEIINEYQESVYIGANNNIHMAIEPSGDVGIGVYPPSSVGTNYKTLHIRGANTTIGGAVRLSSSDSTVDGAMFSADSLGIVTTSYSNHPINFYTNSEFSTPKMTIAANGNIGIANSDPTELLYVEGDIEVGAKRSLYEAYLSNTVNWVKIYEKHYQSSSAFNYGGQHVLVTQGGATGGQSSYAHIHINNKQQGTGDHNTIVYTEGGGERVMDVAYYYDSAGGDYSGGLLTVWVKAVLNYMTVAVHGLSTSKPDKDNAGQLMAVNTGSETQPASSTLLSPNITNLETTKVGIGNSTPDVKLAVTTDEQVIARFKSTNTSITGIRLEGLDNSAADAVYVDWFYDAENRKYGFGEGTNSGQLPISAGLSTADIVFSSGYTGIGESSPSSKLHVKDGGYGIRIGSDTVHTDTTNIPTTEMIMFNRTTDGADLASIGVMDGAAGRMALFSREGFKFYVGGGIDWTNTSLGFTIDNVGNIVYPPSGSDTGLYFGGETSGSSYGYIRNPAGTDGQIEIGSDAGVTFTETDNDVVKAMFDLNNGLFNFYGTVRPGTTNTYDLGTSSLRWNNIYTNDLHLSNEGKEGGNDVDGTTGDWTIQEGEEDLYIVNNKSGKKYKFKLEEV